MFPQLSEHARKLLDDVIKHPLKPGDKRRCRVPDKPNHPLHIWSILKNCIGKDLSKIPMPVFHKFIFVIFVLIICKVYFFIGKFF